MLSIFNRKNLVELVSCVNRICDLTAPNRPRSEESRAETRYSRSIPIVVGPFEHDDDAANGLFVGLTRDLSDHGIGIVVDREIETEELFVAFWFGEEETQEPWFFRGRVKTQRRTGMGLWSVGIEFEEFMNRSRRKQIAPLFDRAKKLLAVETCS